MWPFSKKKVEEKTTEQEPWFIVNSDYYKKYGHLYKTYFNTLGWKCFYESGITHVNNIPVSCYEEGVRMCCIRNRIIERLGIEETVDSALFSFERKNTVNDVLDKLNKFKAEHELDDLETKVIDNMINQYSKEDK